MEVLEFTAVEKIYLKDVMSYRLPRIHIYMYDSIGLIILRRAQRFFFLFFRPLEPITFRSVFQSQGVICLISSYLHKLDAWPLVTSKLSLLQSSFFTVQFTQHSTHWLCPTFYLCFLICCQIFKISDFQICKRIQTNLQFLRMF